MRSLFSSGAPPDEADVDVVTLLPQDAGLKMVVTYMFTFDGKLDVERLRTSLHDLIKYKWRILGARLIYNVKTKTLEHHIPRTFDSSTPPCLFEYKTYDTLLDKHIVQLKCLPDDISIQPVPVRNYPFAGFNPKRTFKTYFADPPPPVLSVYCSVFTDATHIGMTLPHTFNDAKGMSEIMNAWSTCLAHGINSTAIPELPLDYNPVSRIAAMHSPIALPGHRHFSTWENVQFVARVVWDLVRKRKESGNIIHFPAAVLERMKREAQTELEESLADNWLPLSKNDILMAWLVKAVFHQDIYTVGGDQTPVGVSFAFDARNRLKSLFPLPYLHNTVGLMCVYPWVTIHEIQTLPLARLALRIRSCMNETLTEDAVQNYLAWCVKNGQKRVIPFPYDGPYFIASSWRNSGFENVDFSAALGSGSGFTTPTPVEDKVEGARAVTGTGRITMLSPMAVSHTPSRRSACIPCEDGEGGIWVFLGMPDVDWEKGWFGSLKQP